MQNNTGTSGTSGTSGHGSTSGISVDPYKTENEICTFKVGDKLICHTISYSWRTDFIKGNSYTIDMVGKVQGGNDGFWLLNETKIQHGFSYPDDYNKYFYSLKEQRKEKLKKIDESR